MTDDRDTSWFSDPSNGGGDGGKKRRPPIRIVPPGADPRDEAIQGVKALLLRTASYTPRKILANATTIFALDPRWSSVLAY